MLEKINLIMITDLLSLIHIPDHTQNLGTTSRKHCRPGWVVPVFGSEGVNRFLCLSRNWQWQPAATVVLLLPLLCSRALSVTPVYSGRDSKAVSITPLPTFNAGGPKHRRAQLPALAADTGKHSMPCVWPWMLGLCLGSAACGAQVILPSIAGAK